MRKAEMIAALNKKYPDIIFDIKEETDCITLLHNKQYDFDDKKSFGVICDICEPYLDEKDKDMFAIVYDYLHELSALEILKDVRAKFPDVIFELKYEDYTGFTLLIHNHEYEENDNTFDNYVLDTAMKYLTDEQKNCFAYVFDHYNELPRLNITI